MSLIIGISIDLTKIDKSRIVVGKNGAKYYNMTVMVNDEPDKYGKDVAVKDGQSKEERERKDKEVFLGNGKVLWSGERKAKGATDKPAAKKEETFNANVGDDSDLPF